MEFRKEYFKSPYYFYLKEGKNDIVLYFSVSNVITEARKKDDSIKFNKKDKNKIEKELTKIFKEKKLKDNDSIKKHLSKLKSELGELVDYDGTFLSSKIPIYNPKIAPKGTMDQEVTQSHQTNNPVTRGYRVYWGESIDDNDDNVVTEIDFSDAFGWEETKDLNGPDSMEVFMDELGVEDPIDAADRVRAFGKNPFKKTKKQTLSEKEKIDEERKQKMVKMVEDILLGKKSKDTDISKKNKALSKLLVKNLESIKKLADKEGISTSELIKILKKSE
jgi:hypothetical protein